MSQTIDLLHFNCLLSFKNSWQINYFQGKNLGAQCNQQIFHEKMDKGYEKEKFESLSIKASVAKKFRRYCKGISKSQSMALLLMLEFFENNGISPNESMGPHMMTLENLIKKRINGVIAIMKDIEKNQTKPTVAMMQSLFKESEPTKKPIVLEKKVFKEKRPTHINEKQNRTNEF